MHFLYVQTSRLKIEVWKQRKLVADRNDESGESEVFGGLAVADLSSCDDESLFPRSVEL